MPFMRTIHTRRFIMGIPIRPIPWGPLLEKDRICGTISAMNIKDDKESGYLSRIGPVIKKRFIEAGFLLRPLGNVLYILPPYCITQSEMDSVYACIRDVLNTL